MSEVFETCNKVENEILGGVYLYIERKEAIECPNPSVVEKKYKLAGLSIGGQSNGAR